MRKLSAPLKGTYLPACFGSVRCFVHVIYRVGNGSCRYDLQQDDVFQRAGYFGQLHLLAAELSASDAEPVTAALAALEGEVAAGWAALSNEGCVDVNLSAVAARPATAVLRAKVMCLEDSYCLFRTHVA